MLSFLLEFTRHLDRVYTVIVVDEQATDPPRQYHLRPRTLWLGLGGVALGAAVLMVCLIVFTPVRELIPGYGTSEIRRDARLNALRLAALQDSLDMQRQYMVQLQQLVMGELDSEMWAGTEAPEGEAVVTGELAGLAAEPSGDWQDHQQPALPLTRLPSAKAAVMPASDAPRRFLPSLRLPALPPVSGYFTRGFDARTGHFAVDIAAEEGTVVRSIGDGYVIFADWTHEGGYVIAVHHADGYVSVYKHNQRLLKRIGDRVRDREAIAVSGNTGEVTTGPHLHFELWRDGLAQDPQTYFIGP